MTAAIASAMSTLASTIAPIAHGGGASACSAAKRRSVARVGAAYVPTAHPGIPAVAAFAAARIKRRIRVQYGRTMFTIAIVTVVAARKRMGTKKRRWNSGQTVPLIIVGT